MLETADLYEHDKTSLGILRIQDSDDHLAPKALNFAAAISMVLTVSQVTAWCPPQQ